MSTSVRVFKNTSYLYVRIGVTILLSVFTTRILLNTLGVDDFGVFNIVGGAIAMLGFFNASMASATQRFMSYAEGEGNEDRKIIIFNVSLLIHLILSLFVCVVLTGAAFIFFNGILNIAQERLYAAKIVYACLVISTFLTIANVPYDAVVSAHENMFYYSVIGIIESILKLFVAFACYYTTHDKLIVYGMLMVCIPAITLTVMKVYCHQRYKECRISLRKYYNHSVMVEMTQFAGWNFLNTFTSLLSGHGANILLNHFFGTALNAANGVCGQMNAYLQSFSNTLQKALNPVIVKSEGGHRREIMYQYAFTGAKLSVLLYAFFAVPAIIDRDYILRLWLKTVPRYTSEFVQLALLWTFCSQIADTLFKTIEAIGKIKEVKIIAACLNLLNLVFIFIAFKNGLPPQSMLAIGCVTAILQVGVVVYFNNKYGGLDVYAYLSKVILKTTMAILVSYSITYWMWSLMEEGIVRCCLICIVSAVISFVSFYIFGLNSNERSKLKTTYHSVCAKK